MSTYGSIHRLGVDTSRGQQVSSCSGSDWQGLMVSSESNDYRLITLVGIGGYGKVFLGVNLKSMAQVAIKVFSCTEEGLFHAQLEVGMLKEVQDLDPDKCNLVKFHEWFVHYGYPCLVFEPLCESLVDLYTDKKPLSLYKIRPIAQQLLVAFKALKKASIMHCDLKPNNVMLVDHLNKPFKVKLIDFGLSRFEEDVGFGDVIQIFSSRAPEVMLGLPITEAAEMWSLGCLLASLFLGSSLYPGHNEYDVMRHIVDTHGKPDHTLLTDGLRTKNLFTKDPSKPDLWRLKTPEEYKSDTGQEYNDSREHIFKKLSQLKRVYKCKNKIEKSDLSAFLDLLKRMLTIDPAKRITPTEALQHHFITMTRLQKYSDCTYQNKSLHAMEFCTEDLPEDDLTDSDNSEKKGVTRWQKVRKFFSRLCGSTS